MTFSATQGTIVVHVNDVRRADRLLEAAVPLARATGAHLVGLAVIPPFVVLPAIDAGGVAATVDSHREAFRDEMVLLKQKFMAATADLGPLAEWREADANFESVALRVMEVGRASDLVMAAQADPDWRSSTLNEDPVRLVMEGGRPVLLIPNAGRNAMPPKRVLVAYDGRREAARAVFDALPLLKSADDVTLVWFNAEPSSSGDVPLADICAALARHGIKSRGVEAHAIGADVGPKLLQLAKTEGADLVVMGCYGHSRLRELILGGASRHILAHMQLPVLLSH